MTTLTANKSRFSSAGPTSIDHLRAAFSDQMSASTRITASAWTQAITESEQSALLDQLVRLSFSEEAGIDREFLKGIDKEIWTLGP